MPGSRCVGVDLCCLRHGDDDASVRDARAAKSPLLQWRWLTGGSLDGTAIPNTSLLSAYRWMATHWGSRERVGAWKKKTRCAVLLFSFDVRAKLCFLVMIPSPKERTCLPEDVKEQNKTKRAI